MIHYSCSIYQISYAERWVVHTDSHPFVLTMEIISIFFFTMYAIYGGVHTAYICNLLEYGSSEDSLYVGYPIMFCSTGPRRILPLVLTYNFSKFFFRVDGCHSEDLLELGLDCL
jgi:hypothetical protein